MPEGETVLLGLTNARALRFDSGDGIHDPANAVAPSISTRALTPAPALPAAACAALVSVL